MRNYDRPPDEKEMALEDREYGAVFTRRWVVNLMLDSCGYLASEDLGSRVAVEPSCGDGAFLRPMVERLSASLKNYGRDLGDAVNSIRAFDLQKDHVEYSRQAVAELLAADGWQVEDAEEVASHWVVHGDYLLTDHGPSADFVIGNPPYIRSEDMPNGLRAEYMNRCTTMTVGSDIFVGFIEVGLRSLAKDGVLCFICADRWMHNTYGKKLRRFVVDGYSVEAVWEMHGVDAFAKEVSAYPAITQVRNTKQGEVRVVTCDESFGESSAKRLQAWLHARTKTVLHGGDFRADVLQSWFDTDDIWPSASPERLAILERLEETLPPLQDAHTGTKVGIGIATGADKVYVTKDSSVAEGDRLLPLVVTGHVRKGSLDWSGTWLVNPWNKDGSLVDLGEFPKMQGYFEHHAGVLKKRHTATKSAESAWYRTIDKVNPDLAAKEKLLLQDMKATIQPIYDKGEYYPHHNLYWITSETWDLKVLGGLLLSRVAQMFVEAYGVKMHGGTLRFQAQYLRTIRVPVSASISPEIKARLVRAFEMRDSEQATRAALVAYGLDELPD